MYLGEHKVAANKRSHPEEHVDNVFSTEDSTECEAVHPLLYNVHVLKCRPLQNVEVCAPQDDHCSRQHAHSVQDLEFGVLWVFECPVLENGREGLLN